jgi:ubiquinone/menaquinone biosynthesis C-methylase UbiE
MNDLMSFGSPHHETHHDRNVGVRAGHCVLDLAGGTGI